MKSIQTLIRRTAISLSAIAALIVTGYAASQTVELRTNGALTASCSYSTMTVSPNGGVVVTCGAAAAGPGTFTVSGPSSMATGATSPSTGTSMVKVTRTLGTTGAVDVGYALTGNCSSTANTISFADGDTVKPIIITAAATSGTCTVGITPSAGNTGGNGTVTIQIVDPNDPVVFSFAASTSNAQIGAPNDLITVTRSGGTAGSFTVPITLSGPLAASVPGAGGSLSTLNLTIPANQASGTVTYTPPSVMPPSTTLTLTLGDAAPNGTQTGTADPAKNTHTITLSGAATGCSANNLTATSLGTPGTGVGNEVRGAGGYVKVFQMPTTALSNSGNGKFGLYNTPYTPEQGPFVTEVKISKCKGDLEPTTDGCYQSSTAINPGGLINQYWMKAPSLRNPMTAFPIKHICLIDTNYSSWFINVRLNYTQFSDPKACNSTPNACGWVAIWQNGSP